MPTAQAPWNVHRMSQLKPAGQSMVFELHSFAVSQRIVHVPLEQPPSQMLGHAPPVGGGAVPH